MEGPGSMALEHRVGVGSLVLPKEQDKMSGEISNHFLSGWDCNTS